MHHHIWKILLTDEAVNLLQSGEYSGSSDDIRDGFIHLSTTEQVPATVEKHFADVSLLIAAECCLDSLGAALRWEPSRGGALFPHLYRPLTMADISLFIPIRDKSFAGTVFQVPANGPAQPT